MLKRGCNDDISISDEKQWAHKVTLSIWIRRNLCRTEREHGVLLSTTSESSLQFLVRNEVGLREISISSVSDKMATNSRTLFKRRILCLYVHTYAMNLHVYVRSSHFILNLRDTEADWLERSIYRAKSLDPILTRNNDYTDTLQIKSINDCSAS